MPPGRPPCKGPAQPQWCHCRQPAPWRAPGSNHGSCATLPLLWASTKVPVEVEATLPDGLGTASIWGLETLGPAQSCLLTTCQDLPGTISQLMTTTPVRTTKQCFVMLGSRHPPEQGCRPAGQLRSLQTMEPQLAPGRQWKLVQRIATRSKLPGSGQVHTCLRRKAAGQGRAGRVSAEQAGPCESGEVWPAPRPVSQTPT